jgi:hypothetical protein
MTDASSALQTLEKDIREIFGSRLQSLVRYGAKAKLVHALVVADSLTADDLRACARRVSAWHDEGLATPLLVPASELGRSLDVFPFELSAIVGDHTVLAGRNPFEGLRVEPNDLRWACEVQARSHLLHLREGFVEARGRDDALSVLIVRSAPAWASVLENMTRLENKPAAADEVTKLVGVKESSNDEAARIFPTYLEAVERLTKQVDGWSAAK